VLRTSVLASSATNETIQWPCDHLDVLLIIEPEDASFAVYDADYTTHAKFWVDGWRPAYLFTRDAAPILCHGLSGTIAHLLHVMPL